MKKWIALLLALTLCVGLAACGAAPSPNTEDPGVHKIGVIVYNTADEEVIGFREYLQGYIEDNFEMVKFLYSDSITTREQEMAFIQNACDAGVEGFMSFRTFDLKAEVELCGKNKAYYMLASGTVSDEEFESVADNPWFLGMFGPGRVFEFTAGADLARVFIREKMGNNYFVLSGGAATGNEMHYQRTLGILDTLSSSYGVYPLKSREEMARSEKTYTWDAGAFTVTIFPGYIRFEDVFNAAAETFRAGNYSAVLSVLPPQEMVTVIGKTPLGVIDSYNTRNLQLFTGGPLKVVIGKYSSMIGPAFALMLNAVTGYAEDFRDNGRAVKVTQGFWISDSQEDYSEKYALSASAAMNAYNFEDLSHVIRLYNPGASLNELVALAEACSYNSVLARRDAG